MKTVSRSVLKSISSATLVSLLFFGSSFPASAEEISPADILIIHSYHPSFDWTKSVHEGMIDVLDDWGQSINLSVEYMDTKRIFTPEHVLGLITLYEAKYSRSPPDLVLCSDNNAFDMLNKYREMIFGFEIPVVFCGVNFFDINEWNSMSNISGVDERPDLGATINLIDSLFPEKPDVAVIFDKSVTGYAYEKGYSEWLDGREDKDRFIYLSEGYPDQIIDAVRTLPKQTVLHYLTYARDPGGAAYSPEELLVRISKTFDMSIFGNYSFMMGQGILGGPIISGYNQGTAAARIAIEILEERRNPQDFQLESSPHIYSFDFRELKNAGISLKQLPPESTVINVPQVFWKEYPTETLLAAAVLILLISGLVVTFRLLRNRETLLHEIGNLNTDLEERVRRRSAELNHAEGALLRSEKLAMLGSLVAGVAHEVNTPLGLGVTGASYLNEQFKSVDKEFNSNKLSPGELLEFLHTGAEISGMISSNLKRAADQISNFKQVAVDQTGESARLIRMSEVLEDFHVSMKNELKRSQVSISIKCPDNIVLIHFPGDIWRILANLLLNSLKHGFSEGEKGNIEIAVKSDEGFLSIEFSDNGRGISNEIVDRIFKPYFTTARDTGGSGLGLHLVRSIVVDRHGGTISVSHRKPRGVSFLLRLPVISPAVTDI